MKGGTLVYEPLPIIGHEYVDTVIPYLLAAKESIKIIVFDFRLYKTEINHPVSRLVAALKQSSDRGVTVKVLNSHEGVKAALLRYGFQSRVLYSDKLVHAKMIVIDEEIVIVGSHNFTQSAFTRNLEVSVLVPSAILGRSLSDYFNTLWGL